MIKKTLYFGNPAYLSLRNKQLVIKLPEVEKNDLPDVIKKDSVRTIPIEDIGVMVLDNQQITITQGLMAALLENTTAIITCDSKQMPSGLLLPLEGHTLYNERFRNQIDASLPLRKQLWQQTVAAKIANQESVLRRLVPGCETHNMQVWAGEVKSDDADNLEGRAAAYYWRNLFPEVPGFVRGREGLPPNNLLNYGYAIVRAVVARSLVGTGLLPTLGIHHRNKYNAYCLADDIMEAYRPVVDEAVKEMMAENRWRTEELTTDVKRQLLGIPVRDVMIGGRKSPLMSAVDITTTSLYKCYAGESRKIVYPEL